jgi:PPOX class probable F420-dependent enzyme
MARREQIQLSEEEVRSFVGSKKTIILTTNGPRGFPHTMPMWFVQEDDGTIRITTYRASQKVKNIQRDPRVSLLVESGLDYAELKGVLMYGHAELIDDPEVVIETFITGSGQRDSEEVRASMKKTATKRVVIRVKPERIVTWDHAKLGGAY